MTNSLTDTSEDLALILALSVYARLRFINNLLPQLLLSPHPRVISILSAGQEGVINTDDLDLKTDYTLAKAVVHSATMTSLALEELSKENPTVSFVHTFPGTVYTGLIDKLLTEATGWKGTLGTVASWALYPVLKLFLMSPKEAGERGLYEATSERFGVGEGGFLSLNQAQEPAGRVEVLEKYRVEGLPKKVWEHTLGIFTAIVNA